MPVYPRWADFNGDDKVDLESSMFVAGLDAASIPEDRKEDDRPYLTDLEVFYYTAKDLGVWHDPYIDIQTKGLDYFASYLDSGDFEIWPRACLSEPNITRVTSRIVGVEQNRLHVNANDRSTASQIYTLLPGTYEAKLDVVLESGETLNFEKEFTIRSGSDEFWDPACIETEIAVSNTEISKDEPNIEITVGSLEDIPIDVKVSGSLEKLTQVTFVKILVTDPDLIINTLADYQVEEDADFWELSRAYNLQEKNYKLTVHIQLADGTTVLEEIRTFKITLFDCSNPPPGITCG